MSIYLKALDYQMKTARLYEDSDRAKQVEAYKAAKQNLTSLLKNTLAEANGQEQVLLATSIQQPCAKAARQYQKALSATYGTNAQQFLSDKMMQIYQNKALKMPHSSFTQAVRLVVAERELNYRYEALQQSTLYVDQQMAKAEYKNAVRDLFSAGFSKMGIAGELKKEAIQARDQTLSFRVFEKLDKWERSSVKALPTP